MIYAVVGSGGKTTLVHKMAEEAMAQGKSVLLTTSTHMLVEPDTLLSDDPKEILGELDKRGYVMALKPGASKSKKEGELSPETYQAVSAVADVTLIEADGSRCLPVKYPNKKEPVIYDNVDQIIVVCGLKGLGKPIEDVVCRKELALRCLNSKGLSWEEVNDLDLDITKIEGYRKDRPVKERDLLEPWHIQKLVREGYIEHMKKQYPDKEVSIYPTCDGSLYQRALAGLIRADKDVELIKKEWFDPKPCLLVVGGGHVGKEVADLGARMDFRVKVLDDRQDLVTRDRFPLAEELICESFDRVAEYAEENGFNVVCTYGHKEDFACVRALMQVPYQYLGMIGSRRKVAELHRLLDEDVAEGRISEAMAQSVHAPIGIPIGAETPGEIAVSILAEIIQARRQASSSSMTAELLESKDAGMLCIIIEKSGSSPRGKGTMMLVTKDQVLGTVGGGSLEAAVIEDARGMAEVSIREYSLNSRDNERLGMICGGNNTVLFIPIEGVE